MPRILVVDDQEHLLRLLHQHLEPAGFEVRTFQDPLLALEQISVIKPDLVVVDLMMPTMQGTEFVERLRNRAETASTPVILMGQKSPDPELWRWEMQAIAQSSLAHVIKPFALRELLDLIHVELDTPSSSPTPAT